MPDTILNALKMSALLIFLTTIKQSVFKSHLSDGETEVQRAQCHTMSQRAEDPNMSTGHQTCIPKQHICCTCAPGLYLFPVPSIIFLLCVNHSVQNASSIQNTGHIGVMVQNAKATESKKTLALQVLTSRGPVAWWNLYGFTAVSPTPGITTGTEEGLWGINICGRNKFHNLKILKTH